MCTANEAFYNDKPPIPKHLLGKTLTLILQENPGGGLLPENLGRGVRLASQNPHPIYDQNLRFSLPYL